MKASKPIKSALMSKSLLSPAVTKVTSLFLIKTGTSHYRELSGTMNLNV